MRIVANGEDAMVTTGRQLAGLLHAGLVVHLVGDLGMGKTTLSRGIVPGLGHDGAVKSPTYTLVEPYEHTRPPVYHFDLYRLGDPEELEFMGIRDYLDGQNLLLVEWPQRGDGVLPPADLVITISREGDGRSIVLQAQTDAGGAVREKAMGMAW